MDRKLGKGIIAVLGANFINLIFNILTNFMLPKMLSVDSYAAIKTFQLYTMYIGVFALGYADGMYLRYGGKNLVDIDRTELKTSLFSFRLLMIIESMILIPLGWVSKDRVLFCFILTILSVNMAGYFKNLYQAVGEFSLYGKILNTTTILTFVSNCILLFVIKTDNYFLFLCSYALVDLIVWGILEMKFCKFLKVPTHNLFSLKIIIEDIKSGFVLLIGNFSNIFLSSMDRWFVKIMMDATQFAYYSFAVSMEGFLNVAITPITTTLYNYFCKKRDYESVTKIRKYLLVVGSFLIASTFFVKGIVELFLKEYTGAMEVLFILFSTQLVYIVIKGIYVNLYKATRTQNKYFIRLVLVLAIGGICNYSFVKIYPFKEAFAYGTLVSAVIWLFFCIFDFKEYKLEMRELIYLFIEIGTLIVCGKCFSSLVGLLIYAGVTSLMINFFMKEEAKALIRYGMNFFKRS